MTSHVNQIREALDDARPVTVLALTALASLEVELKRKEDALRDALWRIETGESLGPNTPARERQIMAKINVRLAALEKPASEADA